MLSAGILGGPGIGYKQDYYASSQLKEAAPETFERYVKRAPYSEKLGKFVDEKKDKVDGKWPESFGEVVMKERPNGFLMFPKITGLDGTKVSDLKDKKKTIDEKTEKKEPLTEKEKLTPQEEKDIGPVLKADIYGGGMALKWTAVVPLAMAIGYLLLVAYFRAKGGYQVEVLHGQKPVGEHYTGGVEGPIE
jgi:hypothetical protein